MVKPIIIIMAAGDGTRANLPVPKQYYGGPSPLVMVLDRFLGTYPLLVVHGAHHGCGLIP